MVRTSCLERKLRTLTGTFLSNNFRNSVVLGVCQDCSYLSLRYLKLLRNLRNAQAIFCVVDNRAHRQACPCEHWGAALYLWVHLHERTLGPVHLDYRSHRILLALMIPRSEPKCQRASCELAEPTRRRHIS